MMELGGNITLVGFKEREVAELIVVKKIVGQYARKMSDTINGFEHLTVSLKEVHKSVDGHAKFELHAKALIHGKAFLSEEISPNIFMALDDVLKRVVEQIRREQGA